MDHRQERRQQSKLGGNAALPKCQPDKLKPKQRKPSSQTELEERISHAKPKVRWSACSTGQHQAAITSDERRPQEGQRSPKEINTISNSQLRTKPTTQWPESPKRGFQLQRHRKSKHHASTGALPRDRCRKFIQLEQDTFFAAARW